MTDNTAREAGILAPGALTDIPGIEVGHADEAVALTGCTVVLCREGAVAGGSVPGLAPGTRETDLLRPGTLVERAHGPRHPAARPYGDRGMNARRDSLRAGLLVLFAAAAPWDAFLFLPGLRIRLTWLLALAILALEIADYARSHWLGVRFELLWPACALLLLALPPAKPDKQKSPWPSVRDYLKLKYSMIRAGVLGTVIGVFPGAGGTIASFIAYDVEKRLSKDPESFGKGAPEGVAAAEASNSSSVGGALVPLLTLGIPGSSSAAVLIGALMIHNLQPGPELFTRHPEVVYTLFSSLFVANIILLFLGLLGARLWIRAALIPKKLLYPMIFAFSFIGSYAVRSSLFDVGVCLAFGILGWLLSRSKIPVSPIVLGMILGTMIEKNLRTTLMMGGFSLFLKRPLSLVLLSLALLSMIVPFVRDFKKAREAKA